MIAPLFRSVAFSWLGIVLFFNPPGIPAGNEIRVLCSNGIKPVVEELIPAFERNSSDKISITYGVSALLTRQIEAGEPFDVAILTDALIDKAVGQSMIKKGTQFPLAKSAMALGVRRGSRKPAIRTVDGLKDALRSASSIAYAREGASAPFFDRTLNTLGLTSEIAPKVRLTENGVQAGVAVARGEAEFCVLPTSEILPIEGIEILGPFPDQLRGYLVMVGGVGVRARQPAAAASFIQFLRSPAAEPVLVRKGMERP